MLTGPDLTKTRPYIYGPIEHLVLRNHLSTRGGRSCEKGYRLACGISHQNYDLLSNYEVVFKMPSICNMRWLAKESISRNQLSFRRCESQKKGCRLICRVRYPTPVQITRYFFMPTAHVMLVGLRKNHQPESVPFRRA
ncbi:hypothetical protein AVEN_2109-1 [Araneus ventricosus]|uniref:Uncharacterized protein n=1 Tax=Araneus ventricosus TaxID=182803 RepID=A0A4Y2JT24_ARAVE|nr:hypothetical protein AVEN_2109-1 [Araneus ventricosus]